MNISLQVFSLLLLLMISIPSHARKGGNGSHGGYTELSTADQVKEAIHDATLYLPGLLWHWSVRPHWVSDARARDMVIRITSSTRYKSLANRENAPFVIIEKEGCTSDDKEKKSAGAATLGKPNEKFCLSIPEIQRIPPLSLNEQVGPLIGHELAHQAGYEEDDARYFQNFLLGVYKHAPEFHTFQRLLNLASLAALKVEEGLRSGGSTSTICLAVGELSTAQKLIEGFDRPVSPVAIASRAVNHQRVHALKNFCERGAPDDERSSLLKQVIGLRKSLKDAETELHSLTSSATLITEIPIFVSESFE